MFKTKQELDTYRATIGTTYVPDVGEIVSLDYRGAPELQRVTCFFCPAICKPVEVKLSRHIYKKRGKHTHLALGKGKSWLQPHYGVREAPVTIWDSNKWLREYAEKRDAKLFESLTSKGQVLLRFCRREEATHVELYAICGHVARIDRITLTGKVVPWSEELLRQAREQADRFADGEQFRGDMYPSQA